MHDEDDFSKTMNNCTETISEIISPVFDFFCEKGGEDVNNNLRRGQQWIFRTENAK